MEIGTDSFIKALKELKNSIISIKTEKYEDNHKRRLFYSLMDMIAKTVIQKPPSNKTRFLEFIHQFCDWEYSRYVSAQQLAYSLRSCNFPEFSQLSLLAEKTLSSWKTGHAVLLELDIPYAVAEKLWPSGMKLSGKVLDDFTHANLLYLLRNSLVHEMRPLGHPHELFDLQVPHYVHRSELYRDDSNNLALKHASWELIHPISFFVDLVDCAVRNAEQYFVESKINPIDKFGFSSNWIAFK